MATMPPLSDEQLMLLHDGELSRDEARDAERALSGAPEARRKREAISQLGAIFAARMESAEDEAEPELAAMWTKLRAELGSDGYKGAAPVRGKSTSLWASVREWFETYRSHVLTGAVAAAAGALMATLLQGSPAPRPVHSAAAEVESVEVPDGSAMVFQIPAEGSDSAATVIWVNEVTEETKGRGEGPT